MEQWEEDLKKGVEYGSKQQLDLAEYYFMKSLQANPIHKETLKNMGTLRLMQGQIKEGLVYYNQVLDIDPYDVEMMGHIVYIKYNYAVWDGVEEMRLRLLKTLQEHPIQSQPRLLFLKMSFEERFQYMKKLVAQNPELTKIAAQPHYDHTNRPQNKKLKIGYFTSDVGPSPCGYVISSMWENHSHTDFEWHLFSTRKLSQIQEESELVHRQKKAFDFFHDLSEIKDFKKAADYIHAQNIDILIDLNMHISSYFPVMAYKPAPVLINYLGYPSTSGTDFFDYIISDKFCIPEDKQQYFTETVKYMPNCYHVVDVRQEVHPGKVERSVVGLPEDKVIFCCLNSTFKITPHYFDIWMRILKAVPDSVLWLRSFAFETDDYFRKEAEKRGVAKERLIFLSKMPTHADFLYCFKNADLFLDTEGYNAHSTALESLFCGVPLITTPGNSLPARVSSSMLTAFGLPELVFDTEEAYEKAAIEFGLNPEKRKALKEKTAHLAQSKNALFDMVQFTSDFENLLKDIATEKGLL